MMAELKLRTCMFSENKVVVLSAGNYRSIGPPRKRNGSCRMYLENPATDSQIVEFSEYFIANGK